MRAAMLYFLIKAGLTGLLAAAISEIARRYPGWGGLVASLPLTSLLAIGALLAGRYLGWVLWMLRWDWSVPRLSAAGPGV